MAAACAPPEGRWLARPPGQAKGAMVGVPTASALSPDTGRSLRPADTTRSARGVRLRSGSGSGVTWATCRSERTASSSSPWPTMTQPGPSSRQQARRLAARTRAGRRIVPPFLVPDGDWKVDILCGNGRPRGALVTRALPARGVGRRRADDHWARRSMLNCSDNVHSDRASWVVREWACASYPRRRAGDQGRRSHTQGRGRSESGRPDNGRVLATSVSADESTPTKRHGTRTRGAAAAVWAGAPLPRPPAGARARAADNGYRVPGRQGGCVSRRLLLARVSGARRAAAQ